MPDRIGLAHWGVVVCFATLGAIGQPWNGREQLYGSEQAKPRENRFGVGITQITLRRMRCYRLFLWIRYAHRST